MLTDVIKYSGIYAKSCALRSTLLVYDDFKQLAMCANVKEFIDLLGQKETYREAIEEAIEYGANRVSAERSLVKSLYRDYAAMFSFMTSTNERKYFDVVFLKYEIGIIKGLLRRLMDRKNLTNVIPKYDRFLSQHIGLNSEKLATSTNLAELLENMKGTEFYTVLSKINPETGTLFDYEMQLDFHCYIKMHKYQQKYLTGAIRKSQMHISGCDIDLHNIMWIYRAKKFYNIGKEQIYTYLIPHSHRLNTEQIKEFVAAETDEDFMEVLHKSFYKDVFETLDFNTLEKQYNIYMNKQYEAERKRHPYSIVSVMAHLYFKGQEIRNLTTLIECVRYELTSSEAMKKLNVQHETAGDYS